MGRLHRTFCIAGLAGLMLTGCVAPQGRDPIAISAHACTPQRFTGGIPRALESIETGPGWTASLGATVLVCPVPFVRSEGPQEPLIVRVTVQDQHRDAAVALHALVTDKEGEQTEVHRRTTDRYGTGLETIDLTIELDEETAFVYFYTQLPSRDGRAASRLIGYEVVQ